MCHGLSHEILAYIDDIVRDSTPELVSIFSVRIAKPARMSYETMPYTVEEAIQLYSADVSVRMRDWIIDAVIQQGIHYEEYNPTVLRPHIVAKSKEFMEREKNRIQSPDRGLQLVSKVISDDAVQPFLDKATEIYRYASDAATRLALEERHSVDEWGAFHAQNVAVCASLLEKAEQLYNAMLQHNQLYYADIMTGVKMSLDYLQGRSTNLPLEVLNDVSQRCYMYELQTQA